MRPVLSRITSNPAFPVLIVLLAAALRLIALDRVPPGLFYDESANGVDALRVLAGAHSIFFTGNQGREPLLIYLQAATLGLIGPSPLAMRIPSAIIGILTVAATFATFRSLFGRRVGLFASLLLAVSYWHLSLSRLAFRASVLPLFVTLATFWLWNGVRTGRLRHFALAGFSLGLGIYTYIPSRLAPFLVAGWFLGMLLIPGWRNGLSKRRLLAGGLVTVVLFTMTVMPIARYFYDHPRDFLGRIQAEEQTAPGATPLGGFANSVEALALTGDSNPRQDLPGRPLLDWPVVLALAIGIGVALKGWRDGTPIFVLGWSVAMLAPAALSHEPAHALRLVGELPFVLVVAALGLDWLSRLRLPSGWPVGLALVALAFAFTGVSTIHDYFQVWANRPDTQHAFEADTLRSYNLLAKVPAGDSAFTTGDSYEGMPIPAVLDPPVLARSRVFDGLRDFVIPADNGKPVYYVFSRSRLPDSGIPRADNLSLVSASHDALGRVDGWLFRFNPPLTPPAPERPAPARIGSAVETTGVDVQPVIEPGQSEHFTLYWTVDDQLPPGDWIFFAHLVQRNNQQLLGQDYNHGFAPAQWRAGDRVVTSFTIPIAHDAPATVADVDVGIFDQSTGQRLPVSDPRGKPSGSALVSGPIRIDRPTTVVPATHPLHDRFGPAITLRGYDLERTDDGKISLRLHWDADRTVDRDYTVFVHLVDSQGKLVAGADGEPGQAGFPTSTWRVGEAVLDTHLIQQPAGLLPGAHLEVGLYLLSTGQRLPAMTPGGQPLGDFVTIGL